MKRPDPHDLLADAAELVRQAEASLAQARGATEKDIAETVLHEVLDLESEVIQATAPALERREAELRAKVHEAIRSAAGDPTASWHSKHRRWMSPAVKARLVGMIGRRRYQAWFPW
jgi:hypothetical protein